MPVVKVHLQQIIEHCGSATFGNLALDCAEVFLPFFFRCNAPGVSVVDVTDSIAPFVMGSGNDPISIAAHCKLNPVHSHDDVYAFLLHWERALCDQAFQHSLALLIASPERFICEQISTRPEMGVEVSSEVISVANLEAMRAIDATDDTKVNSFSSSFLSSED